MAIQKKYQHRSVIITHDVECAASQATGDHHQRWLLVARGTFKNFPDGGRVGAFIFSTSPSKEHYGKEKHNKIQLGLFGSSPRLFILEFIS